MTGSTDTLVLGRATDADLDGIRALPGLGRSTLARLEVDLHAPDHRCLVVRDATGAVIGFGAVLVGAAEAHLLDVAVASGHRRRGVGSRLVRALRAAARNDLGAQAMTLEVRASNDAARALYRRLGFVEEGVRPDYYPPDGPGGGREDAVLMWDHHLIRDDADDPGEE